MPATHLRFTALLILLMTGCATVVDPYPPVSRDPKVDGETALARTAGQTADAENMPVQIEERKTPAAPVRAVVEERETDEAPLPLQIADQEYPAAGKPGRRRAGQKQADFWQTLRDDFRQSGVRHKKVSKHVALYAKSPRSIENTLKRGEPYLAYIRSEVAKRGFPAEVVLIPFVESGFDPFAYSHGRAAGLWQFIPSTGTYYGLRQDWWYDERRDVVASTEAALNYLDKLQKQFEGDWLLTFAAYNAGGGTVRNAIKRNRKAGKPTDFWHLQLPDETAAYVPKLLAICRIINHPDDYGVDLPEIDSAPVFAIIETGNQLDIVVAAELAEMETEEFHQINPGYNRWATHPDGPHQLAIPVDKAHTFTKNLSALSSSDRVKWLRHKTVKGETLSHIAKRYRTTVKVLQQSNGLADTGIRAGSHLLVPVAAKDASAYATLEKDSQYGNSTAGNINILVEKGDSLWEIAQRHEVTVAQLKSWNDLDDSPVIRPGQHLVIRKDGGKAGAGTRVRTLNYAVRSGDSLYAISKKYNVSISDLEHWNKLHKDSYLKPGQNLLVHVDVTRLTRK